LLAVVALPAVLYAAYRRYAGGGTSLRGFSAVSGFSGFLANGWYLDTVYNTIFVRPLLWLGKSAQAVDEKLVDGFLHLLERVTRGLSKFVAWFDKHIVDGLVNALGNRA